MDCQKFWHLFFSSIDERENCSGASGLITTQLSGEAEHFLVGFDNTGLEYVEAVRPLRETYEKPQRMTQARLHALFDLQPLQANDAQLSKFRSQYEGHLRSHKHRFGWLCFRLTTHQKVTIEYTIIHMYLKSQTSGR